MRLTSSLLYIVSKFVKSEMSLISPVIPNPYTCLCFWSWYFSVIRINLGKHFIENQTLIKLVSRICIRKLWLLDCIRVVILPLVSKQLTRRSVSRFFSNMYKVTSTQLLSLAESNIWNLGRLLWLFSEIFNCSKCHSIPIDPIWKDWFYSFRRCSYYRWRFC